MSTDTTDAAWSALVKEMMASFDAGRAEWKARFPKSTQSHAMAVHAAAAVGIRTTFEKVQALEARLDAFEDRRLMSFAGAFDPGRKYLPGDVVQRSGQIHVCLAATDETPGQSDRWRLLGSTR